jgi:kumamolisin
MWINVADGLWTNGHRGVSPRFARAVLVLAAVSLSVSVTEGPALAHAKPQRLDVVLGLKHNEQALDRFARSVSDPLSPRYGRYLDPRVVGRRFGARPGVIESVRGFLRRHGVRSRVDVTRTFVEALMGAGEARRLFGRPSRLPRVLRGAVSPREILLAPAQPGQSLSHATAGGAVAGAQANLRPPHVRTGTPAGCPRGGAATFDYRSAGGPVAGPAFTPNQIEDAYGVTPLRRAGVDGRGVRVAIYGAGGFGKRELGAYARCFGFDPPTTHLVMVGRQSAGQTNAESALDLQMVSLMAPGIRSLDSYVIGSSSFAVGFAAIIDPRNAPDGHAPNVVSVSQGDCETAEHPAEIRLTEQVLAAAAAAGITVAAGSGDNGSYCLDAPRSAFFPGGASPWLTSVGGTSLKLNDANQIVDETPWNDRSFAPKLGLGGGGGFSRYVRAPWFQRNLGHGGMRANPDVALIADAFPGIAIYCNQRPNGTCDESRPGNPFIAGFGTSAATPLFAGLVALADQRLLAAGRPPLGFVDPLLYELGRKGGEGVLRDVVHGSNDAVYTSCCKAAPGYDMASGWGSVNAAALAAVAVRRGPRESPSAGRNSLSGRRRRSAGA